MEDHFPLIFSHKVIAENFAHQTFKINLDNFVGTCLSVWKGENIIWICLSAQSKVGDAQAMRHIQSQSDLQGMKDGTWNHITERAICKITKIKSKNTLSSTYKTLTPFNLMGDKAPIIFCTIFWIMYLCL